MTFIQRFLLPNIKNYSTAISPKPAVNSPTSEFQDRFVSNPLSSGFQTADEIEITARSNPRIKEILAENKIPLKVNAKELEKLQKGHLYQTRVIASKIYSELPDKLKANVNSQDLQQAAMLHDWGKVLIPEKILNKQSALDDKERKIMETHAELGYELLKGNKLLNKNTLNLIKYHHQTPNNSGYPSVNGDFEYNISSEILLAADKYSALTEERAYKKALPRKEALAIIEEDVEKGNISREVYTALKQATL